MKDDRAKVIFNNIITIRAYKKSVRGKKKCLKKYGEDSNKDLFVSISDNRYLGDCLGIKDVLVSTKKNIEKTEEVKETFDKDKGIIVGNIRMGFGHYRISMAMASCANYLGYKPYWMDLNGYPDTVCTKIISEQNKLYSLGSRLSKDPVFNRLVWEPLNYEGFRALTYNSGDQKRSELMAPVFNNVPKDIPVVVTHCWPAQAAVHAGMKYVVNAVPDNWPMALHLAEGSIHTVQSHFAYQGYRILNGMNKKKVNNPIPDRKIVYTGHYIDHEIVSGIESDCDARIKRKKENKPIRFLLTIGGAGAQKEIFAGIIKHLLPSIKEGKVVLYINVGDYKNVWDDLCEKVPEMKKVSHEHFDDFNETKLFAENALKEDVKIEGIHGFYHKSIFEAVYSTNLLMRSADVLVTKPSELAFYPVPKLFIKRVGKHEMWGAIHSCEIGDGTLESRDLPHIIQMVDMFIKDENFLINMCENIKRNNEMEIYSGAYKVIDLAMKMRQE